MEDCPIQKTPKNGYHYIFRYIDELKDIKSSAKLVKLNGKPIEIGV
jgi:hypothetical protein